MAAALETRYEDVQAELVKSSNGAFEVTVDGRLVYSKFATGRHATHEEIFEQLD